MIGNHVFSVLLILLSLTTFYFLYRQKIFCSALQRSLVVLAGVAITAAAVANWLKAFAAYPRWFLPEVYPVIDVVYFVCLVGGAVALVVALVKSGDETALVEIGKSDSTENSVSAQTANSGAVALGILRDAWRELSAPSPLPELSAQALRKALAISGLRSGALYVANPALAEFTLVCAEGLSQEELAELERLSVSNALLSEALERGELSQSSNFQIGHITRSACIAPIGGAEEPLGALLMLSDGTSFSLPSPARLSIEALCALLGEKRRQADLRSAVRREERRARAQVEESANWMNLSQGALQSALGGEWDAVCARLMGIGGTNYVALIGQTKSASELQTLSCSDPDCDTPRSLISAISETLKRGAPTLLSRKVVVGEESHVTSQTMGLVAPLRADELETPRAALLFWNRDGEFSLSAERWSRLNGLIKLLGRAYQRPDTRGESHLDSALESSLSLFEELESVTSLAQAYDLFFERITQSLPSGSVALLWERESRGALRVRSSWGSTNDRVSELVILPGEGALGRCSALRIRSVEIGQTTMKAHAEEYDSVNRDIFGQSFSRLGTVSAEILIPITPGSDSQHVLSVYLANDYAESANKLARELALLSALLEMRLQPHVTKPDEQTVVVSPDMALLVNSLNNDLSAIVGNCQLAASDPNISGSIERALRLIQERAESVSRKIKEDLVSAGASGIENQQLTSLPANKTQDGTSGISLAQELKRFSEETLVGGQILLSGGKAREVRFELTADCRLALSSQHVQDLTVALIDYVAVTVQDSEVIHCSLNGTSTYAYFNVSQRGRDLSDANRHSGVLSYHSVRDAALKIPSEVRDELVRSDVSIAINNDSGRFISLRIPLQASHVATNERAKPKVLAIDDQSMILDLLQSMCQSIGYEIDVFESPREGLRAFEKNHYDVIISDISMPEMSGWDVAAEIHRQRPDAHIIFITGWGEGIDQARLDAAGVSQALFKPFRLEQLTEALERSRSRPQYS